MWNAPLFLDHFLISSRSGGSTHPERQERSDRRRAVSRRRGEASSKFHASFKFGIIEDILSNQTTQSKARRDHMLSETIAGGDWLLLRNGPKPTKPEGSRPVKVIDRASFNFQNGTGVGLKMSDGPANRGPSNSMNGTSKRGIVAS